MGALFSTFSSGECCPTSGCRASIADDDHGVTGMLKIMIIRHAEKHQHGSRDRGVTEDGRPAHHELTVRGWQRAGALVHLFAPPGGLPAGSRIHTPRSIFASDATGDSPSLRAMHTDRKSTRLNSSHSQISYAVFCLKKKKKKKKQVQTTAEVGEQIVILNTGRRLHKMIPRLWSQTEQRP